MCPLWQAHYFMYMMFGIVGLPSFQAVGAAMKATAHYEITFDPISLRLLVGETATVKVRLNKVGDGESDVGGIFYESKKGSVASVNPKWDFGFSGAMNSSRFTKAQDELILQVKVTGEFVGRAEVCATTHCEYGGSIEQSDTECMNVIVTRKSGALHKALTYSVIVLVVIFYVNMGAAVDTDEVKKIIKRPIGPAIGFMSQFVLMPLLSYGIAIAFIDEQSSRESYESLQLALFITGCSPAGVVSNILTLILGGNLDLSLTMTTISTFSAFIMMPLWILSFGRLISNEAHLRIPDLRIAIFCVVLIVPLFIGIVIKKKLPKVATFLVRILKRFAVFLIVFIVISSIALAVSTKGYLFQTLTLQIIVSGMLLPWIGCILGTLAATLFLQDWKDSLAIRIETGVQNTGLAIFVLGYSLNSPDSEFTPVVPVVVTIMAPVFPILLFIHRKAAEAKRKRKEMNEDIGSTTDVSLMS